MEAQDTRRGRTVRRPRMTGAVENVTRVVWVRSMYYMLEFSFSTAHEMVGMR
jgi:hypothetical protein